MSTRSIAAVLFVLFAYVFFSTAGELEYRRVPWHWTYYASLSEGFLRGQLSMAHDPPPALLALDDPYVMWHREGIPYAWDASLYNGRYYLYFSPLPALLFTIPFRLLTKGYPADSLATAFFCAWAFLAGVALLRRLQLARVLWILLIGVGTLVPFVLVEVRVYEVAIACAMAMTMTWAYTLQRFLERPSVRSAAVMGLFLALTIAARPNLIVLLPVAIFAMRRTPRLMLTAAIPLLAIGGAYAAYNHARFGSPLETGLTYQLTVIPMRGQSPCSLCSTADVDRFLDSLRNYLFLPPYLVRTFPFVEMRTYDVHESVNFPATPEQVAGIAVLAPITILALFLGVPRVPRSSSGSSEGNRSKSAEVPKTPEELRGTEEPRNCQIGWLLLAAAWIILLALSTCRWITARYALDFYGLMLLGSIIIVERSGLSRRMRILAVALALYSIILGLLLGFEGRDGIFEKKRQALTGRSSSSL